MDKCIWLIVIVLQTCFGWDKKVHVNSTKSVCLWDNFGCPVNGTKPTCIFQIRFKETAIVKDVYLNGVRQSDVFINDDIVYRSNISNENTNYTLCISDIRATDAGIYIFENITMSSSILLYVHQKPSIPQLKVLNNGTVDLDLAEIECRSSSNTKPHGLNMSYTWMVNNLTLDQNDGRYYVSNGNTSTLFINVTRRESVNNYLCIATEMYGQSADSDLDLQLVPKSAALVQINSSLQTVKIIEFNVLTLSCEATSAIPEVISYLWYKDKKMLENSTSNIFKYNISRTEGGFFTCTAWNELPINGSDDIEIDVLFGPEVHPLSSVSQVDGFEVNITCNVSSNPKVQNEDFVWKKKDNSSFSTKNQTLIIPHINIKDHGIFECIVSLLLQPTTGEEVNNSDNKTVKIDVFYGPRVSLIEQQKPREDENVNITCKIDSNPKATDANVNWYFGTSNIQQGVQLELPNIKRNQSGMYTCNVSMTLKPTHGQQIEQSNSSTTKIDVLYRPFIQEFKPVEVNEHDIVNLSCRVNANPLAKVHWIYKPTNLTFAETDNATHSAYESSSIFIIPRASCNNTGTYLCVANNSIRNSVNMSSNLFVKCSPRLEKQQGSQRNFSVMQNETFNFTEWFFAYPKPSFRFISDNNTNGNVSHDFEIMNVTDNRFQYRTGIEILKDKFGASDIGRYVLIASNNIGSFNTSYNIMYTRKPDAPILQHINCKDNYGTAKVYWIGGWNGGLDQHFEILYRLTKHEEFTPSSVDADEYWYQLDNLIPNQEYVFKIKACNALGCDESAEVNCTTKDKEQSSGNTSTVIGAAAGSVLGFVVIIIVVVVMVKRRKRNNRKDKEMELLRTRTDDNVHDDNEEGLKDNICYVSADELENVAKPSTEYAVVNKKTQKAKETLGNETNVKGKQRSDVYEDINKEPKSSNAKRIEGKRNKDGLVYVDIVFDKTPNKKKFVIIGEENRTNYSQIDFSKTAKPLPDDDEDEDETAETNNDKTGEY